MDIFFRYERFFNFCHWCGQIDHLVSDCVDFLAQGASLQDCDMDEDLGVPTPKPIPRPRKKNGIPRNGTPLSLTRGYISAHTSEPVTTRVLTASSVPTMLKTRSNLLVPPGFENARIPNSVGKKMATKTYKSKRFKVQMGNDSDMSSAKMSEALEITTAENEDPNLEFGKRIRDEDLLEHEHREERDMDPSKMLN